MPANFQRLVPPPWNVRPLPEFTANTSIALSKPSRSQSGILGAPAAAAVTGCLPLNKHPQSVSQSVSGDPTHKLRVTANTEWKWCWVERTVPTAVCWPRPAARSGGSVCCSTWWCRTGVRYNADVPPSSETSSVDNSPGSPCYSKAHGVLLAADLPTMHYVNCWEGNDRPEGTKRVAGELMQERSAQTTSLFIPFYVSVSHVVVVLISNL